MATAWEGTLAVKEPVDLPRSFLAQRSRTASGKMPGIAEVFPGDGDIGVGGAAIEQHDGAATFLQLLGPDLGVAILAQAAALHP